MAAAWVGRIHDPESRRGRAVAWVLMSVTCILLILDQLGKGWSFATGRQPAGPLELLPGFFVGFQGRNNGNMLSVEGTGSSMAIWTSTAIGFILLGMVLRWAIVLDRDRWTRFDAAAAGILLAGILGNQIDRLFLGYVRDYMVLARFPYQIFNTADLFMVLGAVLLFGSLLANGTANPGPARIG